MLTRGIQYLARRPVAMQQATYLSQFSRMNLATANGDGVSDPKNPRVFFNVAMDGQDIGTLKFELYANDVPKTAENFRSICAGDNPHKYSYKGSSFHRVIQDFMAQGGDFTNHNGTG